MTLASKLCREGEKDVPQADRNKPGKMADTGPFMKGPINQGEGSQGSLLLLLGQTCYYSVSHLALGSLDEEKNRYEARDQLIYTL